MSNGCGCSCAGIGDATTPVVILPPAAGIGCDGGFVLVDGKLLAVVKDPAGGIVVTVAKETWMGGVGVGDLDRGAVEHVVVCGFGVDGRLVDWLFV